MTERIQRALDGELSRHLLTPDEAAELEVYEQIIHETVDRVSPSHAPDLAPALMQRIVLAGSGESRWARAARATRRWLDWTWSPRPLMVRPAYVAGTIVLVLGAALFAVRGAMFEPTSGTTETTGAADAAGAVSAVSAPSVFVHFRIEATDASDVRLAGDFTNWQPRYELHETAAGVWSAIVPLEPGVHHYAFFVDGDHWVPDPHAAQVDDGFGGVNSRLAVLLPE